MSGAGAPAMQRIVKRSRRRTRVSLVYPKGRVIKGLAKGNWKVRPAPLAMLRHRHATPS